MIQKTQISYCHLDIMRPCTVRYWATTSSPKLLWFKLPKQNNSHHYNEKTFSWTCYIAFSVWCILCTLKQSQHKLITDYWHFTTTLINEKYLLKANIITVGICSHYWSSQTTSVMHAPTNNRSTGTIIIHYINKRFCVSSFWSLNMPQGLGTH